MMDAFRNIHGLTSVSCGKNSKETQKGPKTRSKKVQNQILKSGQKLGKKTVQRTMQKKVQKKCILILDPKMGQRA